MTMLDTLKGIPPDHKSLIGICDYVLQHDHNPFSLEHRFKRWPGFSGDICFPVPSPDPDVSAEDYYLYKHQDNFWDKGTTYGQSRWDLVRYLIDELTLKEALEAIPEDYNSRNGVCRYLYRKGVSYQLFLQLAKQWPGHSGSYNYPVPSPDPDFSPFEYYELAQDQGLWDKSTTYGQHRHSLVNFVKELLQ